MKDINVEALTPEQHEAYDEWKNVYMEHHPHDEEIGDNGDAIGDNNEDISDDAF